MKILVTGGAGFIGSAVVRYIIKNKDDEVLVIDDLTYAGNLSSLTDIDHNTRFSFKKINICDHIKIQCVINEFQPDAIMHLAAETHVDRSIRQSNEFIQTNIIGTYVLLEAARNYWSRLNLKRKKAFRFHHISTDEVFGDLNNSCSLFTESSPYLPSSPYSASKAASDHLVRAWLRTYGLPTIITNCSNNYGPFHFPEKLIPLVILNAISGKKIPVYGDGSQIRDWIFVDDHAIALYKVVTEGIVGENYNIGGNNEKTNLEVVDLTCSLLEELAPNKPLGVIKYMDLVFFTSDRPGHDKRYAIDSSKIMSMLDWTPNETFESGLRKTVIWYLNNEEWWRCIQDGSYLQNSLSK